MRAVRGQRRLELKTVEYQLVLKGNREIGARVPPRVIAPLFEELPTVVGQSILMAFEGRSTRTGRKPAWLEAAEDIRFVGLAGEDDTVLHFQAPTLGEAAPSLYEQGELWPTKPPPSDTGFDLLAGVLSDVARNDRDSDRYDPTLLRRLSSLGGVLNATFQELDLRGERGGRPIAALNEETLQLARRLIAETPESRRARVVGKLDMMQESTRAFALDLDSGERVRGVLTEGSLTDIKMLFGQRALVVGRAAYRPSGRVLRIEADSIAAGDEESGFWSEIPGPQPSLLSVREVRRPQTSTTGAAAIFGRWPGDESEEELLAALREMG